MLSALLTQPQKFSNQYCSKTHLLVAEVSVIFKLPSIACEHARARTDPHWPALAPRTCEPCITVSVFFHHCSWIDWLSSWSSAVTSVQFRNSLSWRVERSPARRLIKRVRHRRVAVQLSAPPFRHRVTENRSTSTTSLVASYILFLCSRLARWVEPASVVPA